MALPRSRDHSPEAERAYSAQVPRALIDYLIANKGRLAPHLEARRRSHSVRRICTRTISRRWPTYARPDNPLFIPETHADVWYKPSAIDLHQAARNVFCAVAHHDAICFAPFGLEGQEVDGPIAKSLKLVSDLSPLILKYQGTDQMEGILQTEERKSDATQLEGVKDAVSVQASYDVALGGYVAHILYQNASPDDRSYGLIINTAPDEFLIAGDGLAVTFSSATKREVGFAEIWEQIHRNGEWANGRRLNGDQTNQGSAVQIPFWRWDNFDNAPGPRVVKVKLFLRD